ncbi:MAG: TIGR04211 family SH3 domain-containing protein [Gammaproteobacteria bacterium]|nr:TIGR04211 family SH3 domain-containing protein [Gammaproteobacteria bacterium]
MTGSHRALLALALLVFFSSARAETLYVAERLRIGLRAEATETGAVVKTVETGTPLEAIQRTESFVQVRDPQGTVGWVETRYLTPDAPARLRLGKLEEELTKSRKVATDAQAQLKKSQATVAEQTARIEALEKETADNPAPPPAAVPSPPPVAPPVGKTSRDAGFTFSYAWLGISFAMLGIGFAAGVRWLRESIRKRSGGMYLRV